MTGKLTEAYFARLDLDRDRVDRSIGPVRSRRPLWLDVAREYTERWVHQQHIRDAVGRPGLKERRWLAPVLDTFVRGLPRVLGLSAAPDGTTVAPRHQRRRRWRVGGARQDGDWMLGTAPEITADATVTLDEQVAWRLFTKGIAKDRGPRRGADRGRRGAGRARRSILFRSWRRREWGAGDDRNRHRGQSQRDAHDEQAESKRASRLLAGLGVEGDAHQGETVKHRSRVARDPSQPNLRQVHLIHAELHDALREQGFAIAPGQMGENVTTRGVDLLGLPTGARLHLGETAVVAVTGLRNPCAQLDGIQPGLMAATLDRDEEGKLIRKAGIMGVVLAGGEVRPGDAIRVELPPQPHRALEPV